MLELVVDVALPVANRPEVVDLEGLHQQQESHQQEDGPRSRPILGSQGADGPSHHRFPEI
jgi:hypothetical protein